MKRSSYPKAKVVAGLALVALSGVASAQASYASSIATHGQTTQLISTTSLQQMLAISNALAFRNQMLQSGFNRVASNEDRLGMAAGAESSKWNVWGSLAADNMKYDDGAGATMGADSTNTVLGADFALSPAIALGLTTSVDRTTGMFGANGYTSKGYSVAPYVGWQINKELSVDATLGFGKGDFSAAGATIDVDRMFYGTNLNYTRWMGDLQFAGRVSYLHGEEDYELSTTKNKLSQWRAAGQLGYWMNGIQPYVGLAYSTDRRIAANNPPNELGKNAWLWTAGVNFFSLNSGLTGGLVYNRESGRAYGDRDNVMANINYRF